MSIRSPIQAAALLAAMLVSVPAPPSQAQESRFQNVAIDEQRTFSTRELDQILAPIALYPDDLLSNILIASTYPLEVVDAARWIDDRRHARLKGAALERALADKDWDPSVKSLTQFPDVLTMMNEQLDWMRDLGDAVLADQGAVMDRIQFLREKADEAGHLKSNSHQRVVTRTEDEREYYYIEPAEPDVIYVPVYEPSVYGDWWYPDYPPYYWGPADLAFVDFFYWGSGFAIAPNLWRWSSPRWRRHYIHVDPHRYNRLTRHKLKPGVHRWHHSARHRRGVRYRNADLRRRHQRDSVRGARAFRGDFDANRRFNSNRDQRRDAIRRNQRTPRADRDRNPRRDFERRNAKGGKRDFGNTRNRPDVKRRPPQENRASSGPRKPRDAKAKSKPNRNVKQGRGPGVKKPTARKRPPGARNNRGAGPRKASKPRAGNSKGKRQMGARGGGRKAGPRAGGGRKAGPRGGGGRKAASRGGGGRKVGPRGGGGGRKAAASRRGGGGKGNGRSGGKRR